MSFLLQIVMLSWNSLGNTYSTKLISTHLNPIKILYMTIYGAWTGDIPKWMLYSGKSYSNGWLGVPPISGNLHMTINMDHNGSFFWGMMINHRSWVNKGVICLWTSLFRRFFGILCYIISTVYLMWFHNPTIQVHNLWCMSYPIFALAHWCISMYGQTWSIMKYEVNYPTNIYPSTSFRDPRCLKTPLQVANVCRCVSPSPCCLHLCEPRAMCGTRGCYWIPLR